MSRGGARVRSGPPADPNALVRERDGADWLVLPADEITAPAPHWPIVSPSGAELEVWAWVWTLPQSLIWRHKRQERQVARYVRVLLRAEEPDASNVLLDKARMAEDSLLLTEMALRAAKVRIEVARSVEPDDVPDDDAASKQDWLKVVRGDSGAA